MFIAHFGIKVFCRKRYKPFNERAVLFKAPSSKSLQTSCQGCCWISLGRYQPIACWKATKAQHWTWPANLQALPGPCESAEQQWWAEYSNGMSEYRSYSLWQMRSLASYNRIPKQLLVSNMDNHSLDQEVSIHSYSYRYSLFWVVTELFEMTDNRYHF